MTRKQQPSPSKSNGANASRKRKDTIAADQAQEREESCKAAEAAASNRDRMVDIGRGNQQAGRQGSRHVD